MQDFKKNTEKFWVHGGTDLLSAFKAHYKEGGTHLLSGFNEKRSPFPGKYIFAKKISIHCLEQNWFYSYIDKLD